MRDEDRRINEILHLCQEGVTLDSIGQNMSDCAGRTLRERQPAAEALQAAYERLAHYSTELLATNEELQVILEELQVAQAELKQQNLQLAIQQQRYQDLFNFAPHGYVVTDATGIIQEANQAISAKLSVDSRALVGKPLIIFIQVPYRKVFNAQLSNLSSLAQAQTWEANLQPRNGEPFSAEITVAPVRDSSNQVMALRWLIRDITARKQAEEAVRQQAKQEQLLRRITQRIHQSLDLEQILATTVNEVRRILQADRVLIFRLHQDGSGQVIQETVLPEYPVTDRMRWLDECFPDACYEYYCQGQPRIVSDVVTDDWASCLTEFMQAIGVKSKVVAPIVQTTEASTPVWGLLIVHACSYYRQWQQSEADFLQQIAHQLAIAIQQAKLYRKLQIELAEREQAEEALRQSEERFRQAFDNAPIGMALTSLDGQFLKVNRSLCEILGYSEAELLDRTFRDVTYHEERDMDLEGVRLMLRGEIRFYQREKQYFHKQGHVVQALLSVSLVKDRDKKPLYFIAQVQDISDRHQIDRMKDEFISIVSHELRTPLTAIRGSLGILESGAFDDQPEQVKEMLQIALNNSDRLVRLVNDILDLERLESSKTQLLMEACEVANLVQQAIESVQAIADEANVTLCATCQNTQIWVDPDAIVQMLINLLSNAIKFSPTGGTVWLNTELTPSHPTPYICFCVKDRGRGVPPNKLEVIFDRFQQVDISDSRQKGGTGLGLAICKSIVQQHGGQIWVESVLGVGSTFYVTLPTIRQEI